MRKRQVGVISNGRQPDFNFIIIVMRKIYGVFVERGGIVGPRFRKPGMEIQKEVCINDERNPLSNRITETLRISSY